MADSPEEQRRKAEQSARYAAQRAAVATPNPLYGTSPFNPESYLSTTPSPEAVRANPMLADPVPDGRQIDSNIPSDLNTARLKDVQAYRENPKKYIEEHASIQLNEQSLLDKGKSMLSHLLDYRDESDVSLFGVNLSAVETVWDSVLAHVVGTYDVVNVGIGWGISAMPGGVQTLDGGQLSGEKSFMDVFNGEMEPGSAPSPGQIALASIALESKRIREGGARLSDVLLLNPAIAPFILAGIAADTSPLQQEGFNLLDKEQRDKAFGSGWEQWMSGITDAGLVFADPAIGAGVAAKAMRVGMLGMRGSLADAAHLSGAIDKTIDNLHRMDKPLKSGGVVLGDQRGYAGVLQTAEEITRQRVMAGSQPGGVIGTIEDQGQKAVEALRLDLPQITTDMVKPKKFDDPLGSFFWDLSEVHAADDVAKGFKAGKPVMSVEQIMERREMRALTNKGSAASLLHQADSPMLLGLVFKSLSGSKGALVDLQKMAPALADETYRYARAHVNELSLVTEGGSKVNEVEAYLSKSRQNIDDQLDDVNETIRTLTGSQNPKANLKNPNDPLVSKDYRDAVERQSILEATKAQILEMYDIAVNGKQVDWLDPTSAFYNRERASDMLADLHARQDVVTRAMNKDIYQAAVEARAWLPGKDNWLVRATLASRERAARAAYQYSVEGSGILPKRWLAETEREAGAAIPTHKWTKTGWFAPSQFEGVSRLQRSARVWRWLGTETPSGYIALKGTSTVGSEREFEAALNLDLYKGAPIKVIRDGKPEFYGGQARKREFTERFMRALNNPDEDAASVLWDIEQEVMNDMAAVFGHDPKDFEKLLKHAHGKREANLKSIRDNHYFVDEQGGQHYAPFLSVHLASGTYMQNFTELETLLKRHASLDNGEKIRQAFAIPMEKAGNAYEVFNSFWRPLTLLRMGYTTRNVFEGMIRAMAYNGSLMPLTWPVRAAAHGVRNKVVLTKAEKAAHKAEIALESSDYARLYESYAMKVAEHTHLQSAVRRTMPEDSEPMMYLFKRHTDDPSEVLEERMTVAEWNARNKRLTGELDARRTALEANAAKFTAAVKGTAFGKWRERQIEDLTKSQLDAQAHRDALHDIMEEIENKTGTIDVETYERLLQLNELDVVEANTLNAILYHPALAMSEYKGQAGRQKRIGSGTSIGPDGNKYANAWEGPLDKINRGNMSADGTTKQRFSLRYDIYHGLFSKMVPEVHAQIPYNDLARGDWARGVADVLETYSSAPVVQELILRNFDIDEVARWLRNTPEGQKVAQSTSYLFSGREGAALRNDRPKTVPLSEEAQAAGEQSAGVRELARNERFNARPDTFVTEETYLSGERVLEYDAERTLEYVQMISDAVHASIHGSGELQGLLTRRVYQKTGRVGKNNAGGMNASKMTQQEVTEADIHGVLERMSIGEREALGYTQGSTMVYAGTAPALDMYRKSVNALFRVLGTIPEDAVTRGPFYQTRFKATRNALITRYWNDRGFDVAEVKRAQRRAKAAGSGATQDLTLSHPAFRIPSKDLNEIIEKSHRRALADTKEWMYTIDRRTNLGKYGEWIFPFISATQNSATVGGKLLYKQPWLAPFVADLWRMPQRAGFEDDEGNLKIVIPQNWITNTLREHPDIPVFGGAIDENDEIVIPKNGINVFMPETGFGYAPTPAPLVQVAASELMKRNLFTVEAPELLKSAVGDEAAAEMWASLKDYMFGEQSGMSSTLGSADKIVPAWIQRFAGSKDELSSDYGYQFTLQWQTQMARYMAGERDERPTEDEINKRTTNMFLFNMLGNLGVPTPFTPYPILTRPQVKKPEVQLLVDVMRQYQAADPQNAAANFSRDFGDWALPMAATKVTANSGGANINPETDSDIVAFDSLIREVSGDIGDNLDVLGILVNNRGDQTTYDTSAYEWQKAHSIPGRNEPWRKVLSPEEAILERQRVAGWTEYTRRMDNLDARLQNAGFKSYEAAGAVEFKRAKRQFIENMMGNEEYKGWVIDYQDRSGDRTVAAVRVMAGAVNDPTFISKMTGWGKTGTLDAMTQYLYYRNGVLNALKESGHGIDYDGNAMIKLAWDNIRQQLKHGDVRFGDIMNRYLVGDDDPTNPGVFMPVESGVSGG